MSTKKKQLHMKAPAPLHMTVCGLEAFTLLATTEPETFKAAPNQCGNCKRALAKKDKQ